MKKWVWAYCSFLLPALFSFLDMNVSLYVAVRAGLSGLLIAALIYSLWKISLRVHGFVLSEKYGDLVIAAFGILLWAIWFGIAQVILIAYDETTGSPIGITLKGQGYILQKWQTLINERK